MYKTKLNNLILLITFSIATILFFKYFEKTIPTLDFKNYYNLKYYLALINIPDAIYKIDFKTIDYIYTYFVYLTAPFKGFYMDFKIYDLANILTNTFNMLLFFVFGILLSLKLYQKNILINILLFSILSFILIYYFRDVIYLNNVFLIFSLSLPFLYFLLNFIKELKQNYLEVEYLLISFIFLFLITINFL